MGQYLEFAHKIKKYANDNTLSVGLCRLFYLELYLYNNGVYYNKCDDIKISGNDMHRFLISMFRTWKEFSGDDRYPIKICADIVVMHQFDCCCNFYKMPWHKRIYHKDRLFVKRYMKARRQLLDHIINVLEYQLAREVDNELL